MASQHKSTSQSGESSSRAAAGKTSPQHRALIIGISRYKDYPQQRDHVQKERVVDEKETDAPGSAIITYKDLPGAVNDALDVRQHLVEDREISNDNITMLLAPMANRPLPTGLPRSETPTYQKIVAAFEKLAKDSRRGDLVYIHYSGHGACARTVFHDLKGCKHQAGQVKACLADDHCIVPCDITWGGPYLRDVEIGALLQDIVATGAIMTVVFDCCHSGGALRAGGDDEDDDSEDNYVRTRVVDGVYASDDRKDLPIDTMMNRIKRHTACASWMKEPRGFVFLAACTEGEKAQESVWERRTNGRLTHFLLETLKAIKGEGLSTRLLSAEVILHRMLAMITNKGQTPDLIGEKLRFFFGDGARALSPRIYVSEVKLETKRVVFGSGSADLVQPSSTYLILPINHNGNIPADGSIDVQALAKAEITSVRGLDATAKLVRWDQLPSEKWEAIKEGCPAILHSLDSEDKESVRFEELLLSQKWTEELEGRPLIKLWKEGDKTDSTFIVTTVTIDKKGQFYAINHPKLPTLKSFISGIPPKYKLLSSNHGDFKTLLNWLGHLAKFRKIKELQTPKDTSVRRSPLFDLKVDGNIKFNEATGFYDVKEGEPFNLEITNLTDDKLGIVVLNLWPTFEVIGERPSEHSQSFHEIKAPIKKKDSNEIKDRTCCTLSEEFTITYEENRTTMHRLARRGMPLLHTYKIFASSPPHGIDSLRLPSLFDANNKDRGDSDEEDEDDDFVLAARPTAASAKEKEAQRWQVWDLNVQVIP